MIGGHLPFTLSSSHPGSVGIIAGVTVVDVNSAVFDAVCAGIE